MLGLQEDVARRASQIEVRANHGCDNRLNTAVIEVIRLHNDNWATISRL